MAVMGEQLVPTRPPAAAATATRSNPARRLFAWLNCSSNGEHVNDDRKPKKGIRIYTLDIVAAVLVANVALVTAHLKGRCRDKKSEGKECEDASEHGDE